MANKERDICQKDLENMLDVSKATISSTLQTMENNGIIERITSEEDARSKKIILTDKSQNIHKEMVQIFKQLNSKLVEGLSTEEIEKLFELIEKLRQNIQD